MGATTANPLNGYLRSRDQDESTDSLAVAVVVGVNDPTGSLRAGLNRLDGTLRAVGYDPTILFAVVNDPTSAAPYAAEQFARQAQFGHDLSESGTTRCHEIAAYHLARHTSIDCYERRAVKGLAVFIADTPANDGVDPVLVHDTIGDQFGFAIPTADVFTELADRFDIVAVLPTGAPEEADAYWGALGVPIVRAADASTAADSIAAWALALPTA